ncbi:MAG: TonB-dependent receptor [Cytophagales bacterium]|nr:TonB-dependent receptor [Cytophagales bacterium]
MKINALKLLMFASKQILIAFIIQILTMSLLLAGGAEGQSIHRVHVSVQLEDATLMTIFSAIEQQTKFLFMYDEVVKKDPQTFTLDHQGTSVADILTGLSRQTAYEFRQLNRNISVALKKKDLPVKTKVAKVITGKVTDENGEPLSGATILVKGTTIGAIADLEGSYTISVPDDATTLVFTFIGFVPQEISIGGRNVIDVVMVADLTALDELVIVGYGEQSKRKLTSSVAKVTAKDIENLPVTSFDQALQGQAAGVHVQSASGTPGGPVLIRIRGQNSINAGNEPLFVVDGVPIISGSLTNSSIANFGGQTNILSSINPEDIASIEILKDAAATSIYGSRAANGVVLITTKQGFRGKAKVNLEVFSGIGRATELLDVLETEEYLEIKREAYENDGLPIPADLLDVDSTINTDWQDAIYRTARINQYNISLQGGSGQTQFFLSGGFRNEQAILENAGLQRGNFRLNLDHMVNDQFKVGTRIALSRENNDLFTANSSFASPARGAILARPDIPIRDSTGAYTVPVIFRRSLGFNPVAELIEPTFENITSKILANIYVDYQIKNALTFRVDAGYDYNILEQNLFYPSTILSGLFTNGVGTYALNQSNTFNIEPTIRFDKTIGSIHNLSSVVGATFFNQVSKVSSISGIDFVNDDLNFLVSAGEIDNSPSTGTNRSDYSFNSLFARVNYDYKSKYLLSLSVRRDGSSRFGEDRRFGTFWSVSGGWVFSDELFLSNPWFSFGKIRASYGTTGNDRIGNFPSISRWTVVPGYGGVSGLAETQPGDPDLAWEETSKLDLGLELAFFKNKIRLEADYFLNRTKNLLLDRPLPGTTGFNQITTNIGETENTGIELSVDVQVVKTNDFSWNTTLNLTKVNNKIISLVDDEPILFIGGGYIVGESINVLRGLDFIEVNPETGNAVYRDVNEDGQIDFDNDQIVLGNTLPDFYGGMTNTFSWKGISLDIFFQFVKGASLYDSEAAEYFSGGVDRDNQIKAILRRWQRPGDVTDVPKVTTSAGSGFNNALSDRFIWDASYLRVKNITLSYSIPPGLTEKWGIDNARFYVTGTNLFTITDYPGQDPETTSPTGTASGRLNGGNLPQVRMFLLGASLTF